MGRSLCRSSAVRLAGAGPMKGGGEVSGGIDAVSEGRGERGQVGLGLHQGGDGGSVGGAADLELGAHGAGKLDGGGAAAAAAKVADEKDTATVLFCELGEIVEDARGLVGTVGMVGREIAVQGIEDEEARVGSFERVLEYGRVAEGERCGRAGRGDSTEQNEAGWIAAEAEEAGADELGAEVLGGRVEDGAGLAGGGAGWVGVAGCISFAERGCDGEGDPGFSGAGIAGEDGETADGQAVRPEPFDRTLLHVSAIEKVRLGGGGGDGSGSGVGLAGCGVPGRRKKRGIENAAVEICSVSAVFTDMKAPACSGPVFDGGAAFRVCQGGFLFRESTFPRSGGCGSRAGGGSLVSR